MPMRVATADHAADRSLGHSTPRVARALLVAVLIAASWLSARTASAADDAEPNRFEADIRQFEQQDRQNPPPKDAILFLGSSSIRLWNLSESFPDRKVINRGFGGSEISDAVHFADRIVIPYRPRTIVFYAGDNDIAAGKDPQTVAKDFQRFVKKVQAALPETRIIFISIKPSLARWKLVDSMREANQLIEQFTKSDERLLYVDIDKPMIGADGKPRQELFVDDGLHLSAAGYKVWKDTVEPLLEEKASK